ncbi:hypothetical protein BDZ91DRAFT_784825 [Kalaharituber pfeilii]|nr:hypothetical protein BDZ91DRAFT_784825 [Kalaharituber pfeilii]
MGFRSYFTSVPPPDGQDSTPRDPAAITLWIPQTQLQVAAGSQQMPRDPKSLFVEAAERHFDQLWEQFLRERPLQKSQHTRVRYENSRIRTQLYFPIVADERQHELGMEKIQLIHRMLEPPSEVAGQGPGLQHTYNLASFEELDIPELAGVLVKRHIGRLVEESFDTSSINNIDASNFIRYSLDTLALTDLVNQVSERVPVDHHNANSHRINIALRDRLQQCAREWPPTSLPTTRETIGNVEELFKLTIARILLLMYAVPSGMPPITDFTLMESIATMLWCLESQQVVELKTTIQPQLTISMLAVSGSSPPPATESPPAGFDVGAFAWGAVTGIGNYIKNNPGKTAAQVGLTVLSVAPMAVLGPALTLVGFGPTMTGLATAWHSSIGLARAGSFFSMCQSLGAAGRVTAAGAPLVRGVSVAAQATSFVHTTLDAYGWFGSSARRPRQRTGEQGPVERNYAIVLKISGDANGD